MRPPEAVVAVRGLGKSFAGRAVIAGVDLTLAPGALVGLVGANGGGKTTVLRMLAGLLRPDAGEGAVLGHDVRRPGAGLRARVGYMGQRLGLYPDLTVRENLAFRAGAHGLPAGAAADVARTYGLDPVLDIRFERLSGGWARRAQFGATLIHAPPLLLLDEPTAGLDVVTRRDLWGWLDALAAAGTAVVVSTHDLAEAERLPAIMLFEGGRAGTAVAPRALVGEAGSLEDAMLARA